MAARKLVFADPSLRYIIGCCWDIKQPTNNNKIPPVSQLDYLRVKMIAIIVMMVMTS